MSRWQIFHGYVQQSNKCLIVLNHITNKLSRHQYIVVHVPQVQSQTQIISHVHIIQHQIISINVKNYTVIHQQPEAAYNVTMDIYQLHKQTSDVYLLFLIAYPIHPTLRLVLCSTNTYAIFVVLDIYWIMIKLDAFLLLTASNMLWILPQIQ